MFAHSIKKLTFSKYKITQTLVEAIYNLPNLQILKFHYTDFAYFTWEPPEGGFSQLQYLKFESAYPLSLLTTEIQFPALRHLVFDNCRYMTEIPNDIGGIEMLEMIEVDECKTCVFESAKGILEEQSQLGNTLLQLRLGRAINEEREGEKEEIEARVKNNALTLYNCTFRSTTILPRSIKSLKLYDCALNQASLHAVGTLSQLEFLKFDLCDFGYSTWEPSAGGFCKLQCLKIKDKGLKNWVLKDIHFPVLQRLVLKRCKRLDDIPNSIGRIETLESLEVDECYPLIFDSAKRILEEQRQQGNTLLQLRLRSVAQVPIENDDQEKDQEEKKNEHEEESWSWQLYIDNHLMVDVDGNHLTASAILGHDGIVWAQSANFPELKIEEVNGIMTDFATPGSLVPNGLYIGGAKYMVIEGEAGSVINGKNGTGFATIKKTNMSLIIGLYDESMDVSQCNNVVKEIGDYLIDKGL